MNYYQKQLELMAKMTHSINTWPRQLETTITRDNGAKLIVKMGGRYSQMRFYLKERGQTGYRQIPYRQGLDKVTISELAEIQQEFKRNEAMLKIGRA